MRLLLLMLILLRSISGENSFLSNETLHELNEMKYSHESRVMVDEAEFTFTISNVTYAKDVLGIDSYYFSLTFIGEERREQRLAVESLPENVTEYHGVLKMENLEEGGNYFILHHVSQSNQSDCFQSILSCRFGFRQMQFGDIPTHIQ